MSFWPGNVLAIRRRPSTILVWQYGQASCYDPKHWLFGPWMDLELVLCDFTMCCFQINLILFVYTFPKYLEAFGAENQVEFIRLSLIFMLFCYTLAPSNKNICMWT